MTVDSLFVVRERSLVYERRRMRTTRIYVPKNSQYGMPVTQLLYSFVIVGAEAIPMPHNNDGSNGCPVVTEEEELQQAPEYNSDGHGCSIFI